MKGSSSAPQGELNGFLDGGSRLQGELHFEDTFRVDGNLNGKVVSDGDLIVGEKGVVDGELAIGRLYISGTVRGSIRAARHIEISATAKVHADLETPSLVIEDGALFEGKCAMVRPGKSEIGKPPAKVVAPMPRG